jgi:hypothetical protein
MNHHHRKTNENERWEKHQELQDPSGPRESHSNVRNPLFGGPLSHCDRPLSGVPTVVAIDARTSEEESRDFWWNDNSDHSSFSDRKVHAKPELWQIPPPPPRPSKTKSIEISPGVYVRLRGADETWKAIANDFYMPVECICCESTIFCIQNADYVLCPDCRVVSRMDTPSSHGMGGVGLGFKYEDLARWQEDILRDQEISNTDDRKRSADDERADATWLWRNGSVAR